MGSENNISASNEFLLGFVLLLLESPDFIQNFKSVITIEGLSPVISISTYISISGLAVLESGLGALSA